MSRLYLLPLLACAPIAVSAAPVPKEDDAAELARAYGTWTDPDKACKFTLKEGELRVSLPADRHLLGTQHKGARNSAPRALREVEGDFTAVVRVTFPLRERVPKANWPYYSGGVLAWESDKEYLVIRRCGGAVDGSREAMWSHHMTGTASRLSIQEPEKQAESAYLRLKREGKKVATGWSRDGKAWKELDSVDVAWGAKVKVGVVAENCLGVPVEITFDQYSLTLPKK
jgi:regulation of enolase protein 1 (concanavalin A-like superfamily)